MGLAHGFRLDKMMSYMDYSNNIHEGIANLVKFGWRAECTNNAAEEVANKLALCFGRRKRVVPWERTLETRY